MIYSLIQIHSDYFYFNILVGACHAKWEFCIDFLD